MRFASEVAECVYDNQVDFVFIGASWMLGLMTNIMAWVSPALVRMCLFHTVCEHVPFQHDSSVQNLAFLDVASWVPFDSNSSFNTMGAAELFIGRDGSTSHRAGVSGISSAGPLLVHALSLPSMITR
jgi:hypothetical protein